MTAVERRRAAPRHRHADAAQGGPRAAHRRGAASPTTSSSPARCTSRIVRSPYAHARITLDRHVGARSRMPGVVAVLHRRRPAPTSWAGPMPCAWPVTEDMKNPPHYPLAHRQGALRRRRRGRRASPSRDADARDALERSIVDYEPLPAVVDLEDALSRPGASSTTTLGTNTSLHVGRSSPDDGAVDAAFADAAHTVKERYVQQRLIPMAMEPRGVCRRARSRSAATSRSTRRPRSRTSSRS